LKNFSGWNKKSSVNDNPRDFSSDPSDFLKHVIQSRDQIDYEKLSLISQFICGQGKTLCRT